MDRSELLKQLQQAFPVQPVTASLAQGNVGLVVVDVVRGFTREGALADPDSMAPMVRAVGALAEQLQKQLGPRLSTLLLRDTHHPDIPEPPYPPHCVQGTGEDELDPEIEGLQRRPRTTVIDKDCINGFVGAMRPVEAGPEGVVLWRNLLADWVADNELGTLVLVGDCTDICVSDLCVALLSARNHGMLTRVDPAQQREAYVEAITALQVLVHAPACATFDADPDGPMPPGMETLRHPGPLAHHLGLWIAASRGATIVDGFTYE